jgi:hypothetical protein
VTTISEPTAPVAHTPSRAATIELARIETRRMLRQAPIWIGLAASILLAAVEAGNREEWSSQKYVALVPLSVFPLTFGVLVAGVQSGNRDRSHGRPPLAEDAPLEGDARTWARLASLAVPATITALGMLVIGVASRIEGGFWAGDGLSRTDAAVHSVFELMQPVLVVSVIGAAAVAVGRAVRWTGPAIIVGMVLLFFSMGVYWLWNDDPAYTAALVQVQPFDSGPIDLVHTPTVILHNLYLLGLGALCVGLSLRQHPRWQLLGAGAAVAVVAVVAQLVVSPI